MDSGFGRLATSTSSLRAWCWILVITWLALYAWTLSFPLVYDDIPNVLHNPSIQSLWPPWEPLFPRHFSTYSARPVTNLSFAVSYALSGQSPWAHRGLNILIHLASAFTLLFLVRRVLSDGTFGPTLQRMASPLAGAASVIWLAHPVNTLAVTYVTQRAEALMALFFLLTLYASYRSLRAESGTVWSVCAGIACVLGAGSKEVIAVAPFIVFAFDWLFISGGPIRAVRRSPLLYGCLSLGLVLLAALTISGRQASAGSLMEDPDVLGYLTTQAEVIVHYLGLAFWPSNLTFDYQWPMASLRDVWPEAVFLLAVLAMTIFGLVRRSGWAFLLLAFALTLAPSSSLLPIPLLACEYRMYLPLAFLAVLVVSGLFLLADRYRLPGAWLAIICLTLVAVLGMNTIARNGVFASPLTLWRDTALKQPGNYRALAWYGEALVLAGEPAKGLPYLHKALAMQPDNHKTMGKIALAKYLLGQHQEALEYLQNAEAILPGYLPVVRLKPPVLMALGRRDDARKALAELEAVLPDDSIIPVVRRDLERTAKDATP